MSKQKKGKDVSEEHNLERNKENNEEHNKEHSKEGNRRKIIKSTLAGGAIVTAKIMPDEWKEPVLDSIVLPAHAQASGDENVDPTTDPEPNTVTSALFSNTNVT